MVYFIIGIILFAADFVTKYLTVNSFELYESITVIDGILDFTRYHNTGGPWSLFDNFSFIFVIATIAIFVGEFFFFKKHPLTHPVSKLSAALINAGALGNFVDRIFRGYVVDMIKVTFIDYPVFNFADCCIVAGCILMCIYVLFIDSSTKGNPPECKEKENGKDNSRL